MEGVTTGQPTGRQPESAHRAVRTQRLDGVLTARGGESASRGEQRADEPLVEGDGCDKHPCRDSRHGFVRYSRCAHCRRSAPTCRRSSRPSTRSRSAARSAWRAPAAAGCARTTSRQPSGSAARRPRISSRSRRFTRLRTTAEPTARLTTKPTFAGSPARTPSLGGSGERVVPPLENPSPGIAAGTILADTKGPPARRPVRITSRNSSGRRIRDSRGSTTTSRAGRNQRRRQALSRSRPLRRRDAMIARPARVRMRSRKPWTFARRRLFGWNVRLLTRAPQLQVSSVYMNATSYGQPVNGMGDDRPGQTGGTRARPRSCRQG
jgi:hypothetical protein